MKYLLLALVLAGCAPEIKFAHYEEVFNVNHEVTEYKRIEYANGTVGPFVKK
jgi:hypothetical protein